MEKVIYKLDAYENEEDKTELESLKKHDRDSDFESAIAACGFGKFNILLLLVLIPSAWGFLFEISATAFMIPVAHCDLNMSLESEGYLMSITHIGMLAGGIVWGFISDAIGRRKLLIISYLSTATFNVIAAMSQHYTLILFAKFCGGFTIIGAFNSVNTVMSEFHGAKHRARIFIVSGMALNSSTIVMPLISLGILTKAIAVSFFDGRFVLYSWNIYLLICSLPSLISGICYIFMPESPKFLMSAGRNDEALKVFKKMYTLNTGKPAEDYPIKVLVEESTQVKRSATSALINGFSQMKPLFMTPLLQKLLLVCSIELTCLIGLGTMRSWMPQLLSAINDYKALHNGTESNMCEMLNVLQKHKVVETDTEDECIVNYENSSIYSISLVTAVVSIALGLLVGLIINLTGQKIIMVFLSVAAGISGICLYYAYGALSSIVLLTIFISFTSIYKPICMSVLVSSFPTTMRGTTISIVGTFGRTGPIIGSAIFPFLIESGCLPPFLFIGMSLVLCGILTVFLPKTDQKALE